jgi:hypothetical protein
VPITATRAGLSSRWGGVALAVNAAPAVSRNVLRVMGIGETSSKNNYVVTNLFVT